MEYILLDTNILIYCEENKLSRYVLTLSRFLMDSVEYKLCIHSLSIKELESYKNEIQKEVIFSKVCTYGILTNPPEIENDYDKN